MRLVRTLTSMFGWTMDILILKGAISKARLWKQVSQKKLGKPGALRRSILQLPIEMRNRHPDLVFPDGQLDES